MHLTPVIRRGSFGLSDSSVRTSWNPRPSLTAVSRGAVISRPFGPTGLSGHDKAWRHDNARATSLCSTLLAFLFACCARFAAGRRVEGREEGLFFSSPSHFTLCRL